MKQWIAGVGIFCAALLSTQAQAFAVFPIDVDSSLKWGDNANGTPGGVITWSFMPAGTPGDADFCGDACPGLSVDAINIENFPGGGFSLRTLTSLEPFISAAFDKWSAAANISFVKFDSDSGVAINDPSAVAGATGHIRIGAFNFASGGGAVGFAPPPNGGTGAGDIIFAANSFYQFAPGDEGDAYSTTFAPNDFESLLLHEMGHAIGLAHPPVDGMCPVMQVDFACFGSINRELDADDIAGAQFLYGAPVPEPEVWAMLLAGMGMVGFAARRRMR